MRYSNTILKVITVLLALSTFCETAYAGTAPVIEDIHYKSLVRPGESVILTMDAFDADNDITTYYWRAYQGTFQAGTEVSLPADNGSSIEWTAPADPAYARIQARVYDSEGSSSYRYFLICVSTFVHSGSLGEFDSPVDVAVDTAWNIYVTSRDGITILDRYGQAVKKIRGLSDPTGVVIDSSGNIAVCENGLRAASIYDSDGNLLRFLGGGRGEFAEPVGICIGPVGRFYVTDMTRCEIKVFSADGAFYDSFGTQGTSSGELSAPSGITFDQLSNQVFVCNQNNKRVEVFNPDGTYVRNIRQSSFGVRARFVRIHGISFMPDGRFMIADTFNSTSYLVDNAGTIVTGCGTFGSNSGALNLPTGIACLPTGRVFVVSHDMHSVEIFQLAEDNDSDTMPDLFEDYYGLDRFDPSDAGGDLDNDGLTNSLEFSYNSDPLNVDSDGDGMPDAWEAFSGLNPTRNDASEDSDEDGLSNIQEFNIGTNPGIPDSDGDTIPDGWEVTEGLDPLDAADGSLDPDLDGLVNADEFAAGTDPFIADTDGGGAGDGFEILVGTDPLNPEDDRKQLADAGPDLNVYPCEDVVLDGTGSYDLENRPLEFSWSQLSGPETVALSNTASPTLTFIAPSKKGVYSFSLVVSTANESSLPGFVNVIVENMAPWAHAGHNRVVPADKPIRLSGVLSADPNGDNLVYKWEVHGSGATLTSDSIVDPLVLFDSPGVYRFTLSVNDGELAAVNESEVYIIAQGRHQHVPSADAGPRQVVKIGETVTLCGRLSCDEDGDTLSYKWNQIRGPAASISTDEIEPFFIPEAVGVYVFSLVVSDGVFESLPALTSVIVTDSVGDVPCASLDGCEHSQPFEDITISGAQSSGLPDAPLSFNFTLVSGPDVKTVLQNGSEFTFRASVPGSYEFELSVSDGVHESPPVRKRVNVTGSYALPPSPEVSVSQGTVFISSDNTSDALRWKSRNIISAKWNARKRMGWSWRDDCITTPDNRNAIFLYVQQPESVPGYECRISWTQFAGPLVAIREVSAKQVAFVPFKAAAYGLKLHVFNGEIELTREIYIVFNDDTNSVPVAKAPNDLCKPPGATIILDGSRSFDPDVPGGGEASLMPRWVQVSGPWISLGDRDTLSPNCEIQIPGMYIFRLYVEDGVARSAPDDVSIRVGNNTFGGPSWFQEWKRKRK